MKKTLCVLALPALLGAGFLLLPHPPGTAAPKPLKGTVGPGSRGTAAPKAREGTLAAPKPLKGTVAAPKARKGTVGFTVPPGTKPTRVHMSSIDGASAEFPSLWGMVEHSHVIVKGRATGVVRQDTVPQNTTDPAVRIGNATVYSFEVEEYLKGDGPSTIKIYQSGGFAQGEFYLEDDNPFLVIGERYLLFLRDPRQSPDVKHFGFMPAIVGGRVYRVAEPDEFWFFFPFHGKVLLQNGMTRPATDEYHPHLGSWHFVSIESPQIIDVPEEQATAAVRDMVQNDGGVRPPRD